MKYKIPERENVRTRTAFLFLPRTINKEIRWLEKASWIEIRTAFYGYVADAWIDEDEADDGNKTS